MLTGSSGAWGSLSVWNKAASHNLYFFLLSTSEVMMKGASILNDGGVQSVFCSHYFLVSIGNLSPNDVDYFGIIYHYPTIITVKFIVGA